MPSGQICTLRFFLHCICSIERELQRSLAAEKARDEAMKLIVQARAPEPLPDLSKVDRGADSMDAFDVSSTAASAAPTTAAPPAPIH